MSGEQRVRAAVNEFVRNVDTRLYGKIDIPHSEAIAGIEPARIPQQRCRLGAGIRGHKRRKTRRCGGHLRRVAR